jgi:hypothetical protein
MIQVTIAASQIDKARLGLNTISLTHFTDTAEPSVAAGSKLECGGALYEATADETATGWAGVSASAIAWLLFTPAGATGAFSYTNTAPTFSTSKQGWYIGDNRVVAMLYKDAASLYQFKNIIPPGQDALTFLAIINSTVNPFVFNLPASSGGGLRIRVVDSSILATGLVQIAPNGTDIIGSAGNVSCYLQNVDQSTYVYKFQFLDLVDSRSGYWAVVGGQLCPDQAVDTDGQQYHLGKLHHLPLGNTTSRAAPFSAVLPGATTWYGFTTVAGSVGVPAGAKAIRAKIYLQLYSTAAGANSVSLYFSDNNSNTPTISTAHPGVMFTHVAAAAAEQPVYMTELDIPLNSSGQFNFYQLLSVNNTNGNSRVTVAVVGFYMGD